MNESDNSQRLLQEFRQTRVYFFKLVDGDSPKAFL